MSQSNISNYKCLFLTEYLPLKLLISHWREIEIAYLGAYRDVIKAAAGIKGDIFIGVGELRGGLLTA